MCSINYSESSLATGKDAFHINAAAITTTGKAGAASSCANGFVEIDAKIYCDGILAPANAGAKAGIIQSKYPYVANTFC